MADSNQIYEIFDDFLQKTVIEKKSFFPDNNNSNGEIFNKDNLEELVARYVKNYIGSVNKDDNAKNLLESLINSGEKNKNESLSFEDKIKEQFKANNIFKSKYAVSNDAKIVFGHLMWLQYLPATKPQGDDKTFGKNKCAQIKSITGLDVKYECDGRAKYGMAAMRLDEDLTDLVLLFNELVQGNSGTQKLENVKNYIIKWCLDLEGIRKNVYCSKAIGRKCPTELLPIHNMLLHFCKKEHYDDISVTGHKKKIVETFDGLIPRKSEKEKELDLDKASDILDDDKKYNKRYYIILNEIYRQFHKDKQSNDYKNLWGDNCIGEDVKIYDSQYKNLWNVGQDKDYSDINALKFKKAIILYGPPGTSKTYSAKGLAKNLIYRMDYPKNVADFLDNSNDIEKNQIHRLQLHPNHTYEDFIWGYQIESKEYRNKSGNIVCVGNQTVAKKGYFLRLIDKISEEEKEKTHVLILDEINRVDLSRLFGELFSAIENRNESVDLTVEEENSWKISIPENLYIIGTMNEIDFSLERVDFALRRRFAWFPYGYNESRLKDILRDKLDNKPVSNFDVDLQEKYIAHCTALNKMIDNDKELGFQYEIGHTFFSELVDIWRDMPRREIKYIQEILWNISISPMIKAYLGNCDEKDKIDDRIEPFKKAFLVEKDKE